MGWIPWSFGYTAPHIIFLCEEPTRALVNKSGKKQAPHLISLSYPHPLTPTHTHTHTHHFSSTTDLLVDRKQEPPN